MNIEEEDAFHWRQGGSHEKINLVRKPLNFLVMFDQTTVDTFFCLFKTLLDCKSA